MEGGVRFYIRFDEKRAADIPDTSAGSVVDTDSHPQSQWALHAENGFIEPARRFAWWKINYEENPAVRCLTRAEKIYLDTIRPKTRGVKCIGIFYFNVLRCLDRNINLDDAFAKQKAMTAAWLINRY